MPPTQLEANQAFPFHWQIHVCLCASVFVSPTKVNTNLILLFSYTLQLNHSQHSKKGWWGEWGPLLPTDPDMIPGSDAY